MRLLLLVAVMGVVGCSGGGSTGGAAGIGTYAMNSKPFSGACLLLGVPTTEYDFTGTLSRPTDAGRYTFTSVASDGTTDVFDAGFDGQFATFAQSVSGTFGLLDGGSCAPCKTTFLQTGQFALLSPSQNEAAMGTCPANALTGGVTANEDAGVFAPQLTADGGLDAVRVCGEIALRVVAEGINCDPACTGCSATFKVTGTRR